MDNQQKDRLCEVYDQLVNDHKTNFQALTENVRGEELVKYQGRDRIKDLQNMLNGILGTKLDLDGIYGNKTAGAVRRLQKQLEVNEDGDFGPETLAAVKTNYARALPTHGFVPPAASRKLKYAPWKKSNPNGFDRVSIDNPDTKDDPLAKEPAPVKKPFKDKKTAGLSQASYNLIIKYEVGGGEVYYNNRLKKPTWPGGASGVTIGIGYDLGYNSKPQFTKDWKKHLSNEDFKSLEGTLNVKGTNAKGLIRGVKDIEIPWEAAEEVFNNSTLPRFMRLTRQAFPGVERLHPDVYGALVSLVFNRGSSMRANRENTRREMVNIRNAITSGKYNEEELKIYISDQVRSMKRLWVNKGLDGLLTRRDAEARLIRNAV